MKSLFPDHKNCFCAYCRSPRKVYIKKHISGTNVLLSFLLSFTLMLAVWRSLDPRVLFIFVVSLCMAEIFVQIRWRMSLACKHCGFDPILYMRSPEAAAKKVRRFFESRSSDLDFYFTDSPLLKKAKRSQLKLMLEPTEDSQLEAPAHFKLTEQSEAQESIDLQLPDT